MLSPQSNLRVVDNYQFDSKQIQQENGFQIMHAKNLILNQMFTLKKLPLTSTKNKQKYQLMLNEVTVLKELNSVNIVRCHKILKTTNNLYLVYDYCNGKTLEQIIDKWKHQIEIDYKKKTKVTKQQVINLQLIEMIGKQLCQVLKELKKYCIVHSMLMPKYIYVSDNYVLKVTNFMYGIILPKNNQEKILDSSQIQQRINPSQFTDPFFTQTHHVGYYSDVYSFGKILQKLHQIYKKSIRYVRHKRLIDLIQKMTMQNPYQRASIQQIYEYFFKPIPKQVKQKLLQKKTSIPPEIRIKSIDETRQRKLTQQKQKKQQLSKQKNLTKSLSPVNQFTKKHHSKVKENSEVGSDISDSSFNSNASRLGVQKNYKILLQHLFKKRNICIFLTQLASITANIIKGNKLTVIKLAFMLQKRSTIEISNIAKYLSKGSNNFLSIIPQEIRFKFTKTEDYFKFTKIIGNQLQQYRKVLQNLVTSIQSNLINLQNVDPQFKKQLQTDSYNQFLYKKTTFEYLRYFLSQRVEFLKGKNVKDFQKIVAKISLLSEIYQFDNFDLMFDMIIDEKIINLLEQPILIKRFKMTQQQLCSLIKHKLSKVQKFYLTQQQDSHPKKK